MRGVVVVLIAVFTAALALFVAGATIAPVGDHVIEHADTSAIDGESTIQSLYDTVFIWVPLVLIGGMALWAVAWYLRRERFVGRSGP